MDFFTRKELIALAEHPESPSVSIYLPTGPGAPQSQQNKIRFKNLLREAQRILEEEDLSEETRERILAPGESLLREDRFWVHQSQGFAAFFSENLSQTFRLPVNFPELVMVGGRFHLKPILPLITRDVRFYLLALSQSHPVLYRCTRQQIEEVGAESMPKGLADVLRFEEPIEYFKSYGSAPPASGGKPQMFHGHGGATDDVKDRIFQYFRHIDQALRELLHEENVPLILAGLDYLLPVYRDANTYPGLMEEEVAGNPKDLEAAELHRRAWEILESRIKGVREEAVGEFQRLAGTGLTSTHIEEVVPAAYFGRVNTLFVDLRDQKWGFFDPDRNRVTVQETKKPGDDDLLDLAAVHTLMKGGSVFALERGDLPGSGSVAAVFRY